MKDKTIIYTNEFRWRNNFVLEQKIKEIQHKKVDSKSIGIYAKWVEVKIDNRRIRKGTKH